MTDDDYASVVLVLLLCILAVAALSGCSTDQWRVGFHAANAADAATTIDGLNRGCVEASPLTGSNPSDTTVVAIALAQSVLAAACVPTRRRQREGLLAGVHHNQTGCGRVECGAVVRIGEVMDYEALCERLCAATFVSLKFEQQRNDDASTMRQAAAAIRELRMEVERLRGVLREARGEVEYMASGMTHAAWKTIGAQKVLAHINAALAGEKP